MGSTSEILNELVWGTAQISLVFRHFPVFVTHTQGLQLLGKPETLILLPLNFPFWKELEKDFRVK